ncbi:DUF2813 domain-containing protein [Veronia pacifica]|uniref:ATP-dependent endonuclease n=1 Tax=Veronia pacifica TaxID=1080227 RepID=A0A1C3EAP8_9GAMM|nr:DUF2813 domain-containing protein [Veronia pacifica]ODA30274.1 ATP-dependent endonuclease [Veronia pacifica]
MKLERIEISGFRGIRRLSLSLDELTVLIGENAWGKSSLLDALSLSLNPDGELYQFEKKDFHIDHTLGNDQFTQLQIVLRWQESFSGENRARRYRQFAPVWNGNNGGLRQIDYRVSATLEDNKVDTEWDFLDIEGNICDIENKQELAIALMRLHPIIRMRDSRWLRNNNEDERKRNTRLERRLANTARRLELMPGHVNKGEIRSGFRAMRTLLDHYFAFDKENPENRIIDPYRHLNMSSSNIHPLEVVAMNTSNHSRLLLMGMLNTFIRGRGPRQLKSNARPVFIFEDPEGRLHPTLLSQAWRLIQIMPMQKVITTNSGDLLSSVPLTSIRRLERGPTHTQTFQVPQRKLGANEMRKIAFHVRIHRPSALFARCWLLVEGETEVWLFSELARLKGYDLSAEGVNIIEFAQSGLKPLIKVAKALGIQWHLIADGDPAGQKYAHTARSMLDGDSEMHRLTVLPTEDIERFLFDNGYSELFREMAGILEDEKISPRKIISKAVKRFAKPDAALAIVAYTENQKAGEVPVLLRRTLQRVISMARGIG